VFRQTAAGSAPILETPEDRRDKFLDPYFRRAKPNQVVAIVKGREPARIMIAIGNKKDNRWHLQIAQRWVVRYNFYAHDERWGRRFVRRCPYLPFSARVCWNQHHWLALRMREEGIDFQQCTNAFLKCSHPARLQELADSLTARDLLNGGQKWLATFTPFFTERERKQAGCQHRLFFAQVELCWPCSIQHASTYPLTSRGFSKANGQSSSAAARRWTGWKSGCWTRIGPSASPTRSP